MKNSKNILIALVLASLTGSVWAGANGMTGNDILKYCVASKPNDVPADRYGQDMVVACVSNLQATIETALALTGGIQICLPKDTTPDDVMRATLSFLKIYPGEKNKLASSIYVATMQLRWPCKK